MDLHALLTPEGGLNKQAATPHRFVDLLTNAAESQRTHDLSILLEVVLKTNNRSVLNNVFMCKLKPTGIQVLFATLQRSRSMFLQTPVLRKSLRVLQHLEKHGVVEGKRLNICTHKFCMEKIPMLLYDLTKHGDTHVRVLACKLQKVLCVY